MNAVLSEKQSNLFLYFIDNCVPAERDARTRIDCVAVNEGMSLSYNEHLTNVLFTYSWNCLELFLKCII